MTQKTLFGQTGGGVLKTATIEQTGAGDYQVWVSTRRHAELQAMLTDYGNMVLHDSTGIVAVLELSNTAYLTLRGLEERADFETIDYLKYQDCLHGTTYAAHL